MDNSVYHIQNAQTLKFQRFNDFLSKNLNGNLKPRSEAACRETLKSQQTRKMKVDVRKRGEKLRNLLNRQISFICPTDYKNYNLYVVICIKFTVLGKYTQNPQRH